MHGIWVPVDLFLSLILSLVLVTRVALESSGGWVHGDALEVGYSISGWLAVRSCGELLGESIGAGT